LISKSDPLSMVPFRCNLTYILITCNYILVIFYLIITYFSGYVLIFMIDTSRWLQPIFEGSNGDIMPDINVSISNLGKACQDYISIVGTLYLDISKCCLFRLESCCHSCKYLLSIFMIICLVWLIIISAIIDPYWWASLIIISKY